MMMGDLFVEMIPLFKAISNLIKGSVPLTSDNLGVFFTCHTEIMMKPCPHRR